MNRIATLLALVVLLATLTDCKGPEYTHYANRFTEPIHDLVTSSPLRKTGDTTLVLSVITVEVINNEAVKNDVREVAQGDTCMLFFDSELTLRKKQGPRVLVEYTSDSDGSRFALPTDEQCPVGTRFIMFEADYTH
jgi:hypothetical protein